MLEKLKVEAERLGTGSFAFAFLFSCWFESSGMSRISRPKEGDQVFLKLDEYSPSWRQALVIHCSSRNHVILVVRVTNPEIEERTDEVSFFEAKGQKFILVEGGKEQLRPTCAHAHRALEVSPSFLLEKGKELLTKDELLYVTTSEDLPVEKTKREQTQKEEISSSDDLGASDSEGEDAVMNLLLKAQGSRPEKATSSVSKRKDSESKTVRYPLLEGQKNQKSASAVGFDKLVERLVSAEGQEPAETNLNTLLSLEVLKSLKDKKSKRRMSSTERSSESDTSSSDSDDPRPRGAGKALRDFRQVHHKMKKRPLKHVKKYVKEVEENLGVTKHTPYSLSDYSKSLNWGKNKTLM